MGEPFPQHQRRSLWQGNNIMLFKISAHDDMVDGRQHALRRGLRIAITGTRKNPKGAFCLEKAADLPGFLELGF
jgi:hypothetical protein